MGAKDLEWRRGGTKATSADGGRDLEAVFHLVRPDGSFDPQHWWIQVKGRSKTVEPTAVQESILSAANRSEVDVVDSHEHAILKSISRLGRDLASTTRSASRNRKYHPKLSSSSVMLCSRAFEKNSGMPAQQIVHASAAIPLSTRLCALTRHSGTGFRRSQPAPCRPALGGGSPWRNITSPAKSVSV
jgi:hypothetical protein